MSFFGTMGLILFMLGLVFSIPIVLDYLGTGLVERFPTLIACGFTIVAALLSIFSGLILQTMIQKNRQEFEFRLQLAQDLYSMRLRRNEKENG